MSSKIAPRLFCDFGNYDAALIIEDREEFFQRLGRAVAKKLPGWIMGHGAMQYYDPQRPAYWHLWPALNGSGWKHMRYMYQREYRVRWKPPSPRTDLKAFTVWLGSLKDISRIVTL